MSVRLCQYNLIAAGFYDGVMLYSQALNETLSQQRTGPGPVTRPRGDVVTKKMWNKTFPGDSFLFLSCVCSGRTLRSRWKCAASLGPIRAQLWMRTVCSENVCY